VHVHPAVLAVGPPQPELAALHDGRLGQHAGEHGQYGLAVVGVDVVDRRHAAVVGLLGVLQYRLLVRADVDQRAGAVDHGDDVVAVLDQPAEALLGAAQVLVGAQARDHQDERGERDHHHHCEVDQQPTAARRPVQRVVADRAGRHPTRGQVAGREPDARPAVHRRVEPHLGQRGARPGIAQHAVDPRTDLARVSTGDDGAERVEDRHRVEWPPAAGEQQALDVRRGEVHVPDERAAEHVAVVEQHADRDHRVPGRVERTGEQPEAAAGRAAAGRDRDAAHHRAVRRIEVVRRGARHVPAGALQRDVVHLGAEGEVRRVLDEVTQRGRFLRVVAALAERTRGAERAERGGQLLQALDQMRGGVGERLRGLGAAGLLDRARVGAVPADAEDAEGGEQADADRQAEGPGPEQPGTPRLRHVAQDRRGQRPPEWKCQYPLVGWRV
jgi:hypothetical protein